MELERNEDKKESVLWIFSRVKNMLMQTSGLRGSCSTSYCPKLRQSGSYTLSDKFTLMTLLLY